MTDRVVKCFSCCINMAVKETDSPLQIKRKQIAIVTCSLGLILTWNMLYSSIAARRPFIMISMMMFSSLASFILFILCVLKWQVTDRLLNGVSAYYCLIVLAGDLDSAMMQVSPAWPLFIPLIDVLLVIEAPSESTYIAVGVCCTWLFIISTEKYVRFGMLDLELGNNCQATRREAYDCEKLPCARTFWNTVGTLSTQLCIFLVDFFCTRRFAVSVLKEKTRILSSIETANLIAGSLSRFDLDEAARLLEGATIPSDLKVAFEQILCNLRSYRPYLPQSCFPENSCCDEEDDSFDSEQSPLGSHSQSLGSKNGSSHNASIDAQLSIRRYFEPFCASLLVGNIRNSFQVLESSHKSFESLISVLVSTSSDIIREHRGTIDLFLGDRIFANFGRGRTHAPSCVDAASAMVQATSAIVGPYQEASSNELSVNFGLGSGKLYCGDLGSTTLMRYSVIGKLSVFVGVIERVSNLTGTSILAEEGIYRLVKHTAEVRVHLQTVLFNGSTHLLYEIVPKAANIEEAEWMYQLEQAGAGKWDAFNRIATDLLTKKSHQSGSPQLSVFDNVNDVHVMRLKVLIENGPPDPIVVNY